MSPNIQPVSKPSAPQKADVVPLLVVLAVAALVAVLVDVTLLERALTAGDGTAWALFVIVLIAVLVLGAVARKVWANGSR